MVRFTIGLGLLLLFGWTQPAHAETQKAPVERPKLLLLDLKPILVKPEVAQILTTLVSAEISQYQKFNVVTSLDIRKMAALQDDKRKAGCDTDATCMADLAGSIGARFVIFGDVGQLGEKIILTLNLFDSKKAKAVARSIINANGIEDVPTKLPAGIRDLLSVELPAPIPTEKATAPTAQAAQPQPTQPQPAPTVENPGPAFPWLRVGSGVVLAAAGAGALAWGLPALQEANKLADEVAQMDSKNTPSTQAFFNAKQTEANAARADYEAGPMYGVWGGGALVAIGVAYVIYTSVTHGAEE